MCLFHTDVENGALVATDTVDHILQIGAEPVDEQRQQFDFHQLLDGTVHVALVSPVVFLGDTVHRPVKGPLDGSEAFIGFLGIGTGVFFVGVVVVVAGLRNHRHWN